MPDFNLYKFSLPDAFDLQSEHQLDLVMVVGHSRIGQVVVGKIAERAGLKVIAETPETAGPLIESQKPGTVILDGGADNKECDALLGLLAAQRHATDGQLPIVILLRNTMAGDRELPANSTIDAVVTKPINPDRLQPLLQKLIEQRRSHADSRQT